MDEAEIRATFSKIIKTEDVSPGIAAIKTLMQMVKVSDVTTLQELRKTMTIATDYMRDMDYPAASISSSSELLLRFISLASLDGVAFSECKRIMIDRGQMFLKKLLDGRGKIAKSASKFILDGSRILTHSRSRGVLYALKEAMGQDKKFEVFVTHSAPDNSGELMKKELDKAGIPSTLILDSAIGYIMETIDFVMVGAEGVAESGGIVNKIGTFTIAMCAKEMKKPFYVMAESFKFSRLFPLGQSDLPLDYKYTSSVRKNMILDKEDPLVDYTPPNYITLLITDIGILTPSGVSDELIKLYI
ncbi:PREDICTED: translation initiation factor eIF-2B subunit alpha [Nicrophorus vespilloides]|uniref:Translation initiation factor eIF2B subunit alpha n=1 Tax=Nicrophorus vespilloides TaxID=110193 RepID=A0ABM1N550_NICVS|nr:PREDICTED: translation initiation factor eIF-2B subunit alpha [Nicrophorus vespilloides]